MNPATEVIRRLEMSVVRRESGETLALRQELIEQVPTIAAITFHRAPVVVDLNGMRNVHGGCFMSFADYSLFAIASSVLQGPGVTVAFSCEFLDAAREGELIECDGEITRAGGSLIFLRGVLKSAERSLFTFSDTIKRVKLKQPAGAGAVAT